VVEAVGARLSGHASFSTLTSRQASAARPSVESGLPVIAINRTPKRLKNGSSDSTSSLPPL